MSVVNDVLRDLDNRKQLEKSNPNLSFFLHANKPIELKQSSWFKYTSVMIVFLMLVLSVYLKIVSFAQQDSISDQNNLMHEVIQVSQDQSAVETVPTSKQVEINQSETLDYNFNKVISVPDYSQNNDVSSNLAIDGNRLNKTDHVSDAIKNNVIKSDKAKVKPEVKIETSIVAPIVKPIKSPLHDFAEILRANPGNVFPLIQSTVPDYHTSIHYLALSAQGEQRTGRFESALDLYKQLIKLDNKDPKWKIGAAISLDKLNQPDLALPLYIKASQTRQLPQTLMQFSLRRIAQIQQGNAQ